MALTKITGEGVGALDTITIGDGSAADKKILFDGNAQDYHIGLDDSTDSLTIGLGSALGTTPHMIFDANGHITKPLQPAFMAKPATQQNDIAADGSNVDVVFGTEVFDQNGDFASSTFTAPISGRYQLNVHMRLNNLDSAAAYYAVLLVTSNITYQYIFDPDFGQDAVLWNTSLSTLADMDAGDTAKVQIVQSGGTAQTDISGGEAIFSGYLVA